MSEGTVVCEQIVIGGLARLYIANGMLMVEALAGLSGVRVVGERVELHGTQALKVDAGGVGYTYTPDGWEYWYPYQGAAYMPSPPEHPLHGGVPYNRHYEPENPGET
jgi:hypothetical protein